MKLGEIYDMAVSMGIDADPRGKKAVKRLLEKEKEAYGKLSVEEKEEFDDERLANPFADTRILNGESDIEVRSLIVGIDMETQELLLADRLREKGRRIDLVLSHHPEGRALAALSDVMTVQADIWQMAGVPINIGEAVLEGRKSEISRLMMPLNHQRPVRAAELLDLPFMCTHTPSDNLVSSFLQKMFDDRDESFTLGELRDELKKIPEYREAAVNNAGPAIVVGNEKRRAGKILVDMTGGTGGPSESIEKLANAGVGTLVGMHMSEKNREEAEKHKVNVVIAGHNSSDSVGMNLILDEIEKRGVEIIPCSGLIRIRRSKSGRTAKPAGDGKSASRRGGQPAKKTAARKAPASNRVRKR